MSHKTEVFEKELIYIKDERVKKFVKTALETLPDYFFVIPSSSTGKYHSKYALGKGGLVRHVRACIRIAVELYRMEMFNHFSDLDKDLILAALFLHDGYKNGKGTSNFTVSTHPLIIAEEIRTNLSFSEILQPEELEIIASNAESHMGQWVFDYKTGKQVLEKPKSKMQNFVHLVDYLASRKCLEMNFNVELSRE